MKVILSIKPEFVEEIISGNKRYEYRKSIFKRNDVSSVVVYATKPYGKIVGEFEIEDILTDDPKNIWEKTKKFSGITKSYFNKYFEGRQKGYAIQIKEFKKYKQPISLQEFDSRLKVPPQSFYYTTGGF